MKKLYSIMIVGAGLLSGLLPHMARSSVGQVTIERHIRNDIREPDDKRATLSIGGLPLVTERIYGTTGMTPKQYGIRYGNGASRQAKVNRKHRGHLHRLKGRRD